MLTVTIELATNKIPKELQNFLHNPVVMEYGIKPDYTETGKEKVKQYISNLQEEVFQLENEMLYHDSEVLRLRKDIEYEKQRMKELRELLNSK